MNLAIFDDVRQLGGQAGLRQSKGKLVTVACLVRLSVQPCARGLWAIPKCAQRNNAKIYSTIKKEGAGWAKMRFR